MSVRVSNLGDLRSFVQRPVPASACCRRAGLAFLGLPLLGLLPLLGGCSMSMPIASLRPAGDDVTGSNSTIPFGRFLDEEDRRREKAALATAMDPQGNGAAVHWENPKSGNRGAFTATGQAYDLDGKVCRGFKSELDLDAKRKTITGTACAVSAGEWSVRRSAS